MKLKLIALLSIAMFSIANAQDNIGSYMQSPSSEAEAMVSLSNPVNQNNTELVMFILKSIEDKGITDLNQKIEFVNTFQISDHMKDRLITTIKNNINYSDHERVGYGMYKINNNKCHNVNNSLNIRGLPDYIKVGSTCIADDYFQC